MANIHHGIKPFDGNYAEYPEIQRALENTLSGTNIKNKKIQPIGDINCRGIYLFGTMSNYPDKGIDYEKGWTMAMICDQHDIDRPGPDNVHIRQELEDFESEVFDNHYKRDVV